MARKYNFKRKSNAFYPEFSNGYVFYNELKEPRGENEHEHSHLWRISVYSSAFDDYIKFRGSNFFNGNLEQKAQELNAIAKNERKKEIAVLKQFYGFDDSEVTKSNILTNKITDKVFKSINEVMGIKEEAEATLAAIKVGRTEDNKGTSYTSNLVKLFYSYFSIEIQDLSKDEKLLSSLLPFFTNEGAINNGKAINKILEEAFEEAFSRALEKIVNATIPSTERFAESNEQTKRFAQRLLDLKRSNNEVLKPFYQNLISAFGLNDRGLQDFLKDKGIKKTLKKSNKTLKAGTFLKTRMTENNSGQATLSEFFAANLASIMREKKIKGISEISFRTGGTAKTKGSNIFSTDILHTVIQGSFTEDKLLSIMGEDPFQLNKTGDRDIDKSTASYKIRQLTEKLANSEIGEYAIIHESTKNYDFLRKSFEASGFHGTTYSLSALQSYFTNVFKIEKANEFLTAIMNTQKDAYLSGSPKTDLSERLSEYISYFLFDDPQTIGNQVTSNGNIIHVFRIDGLIIPFSYLLAATAKAMKAANKEAKQFLTLSIVTSNQLLFGKNGKYTDDASYDTSKKRWDKQREESYMTTKVNISFLKHFNDLLNGDLGTFLK